MKCYKKTMGIRYPQHLLPSRRYKMIRLDDWMKRMFVIRYTEGGVKIPNEQSLRNDVPLHFKDSRWMKGMSVSLCGPFRKKDVGYIIKPYKLDRFSKAWKLGKGVRIPKPKHVEWNPEKGFLGLNIGNLQEVRFPYRFEYKDGNEKKTRTDQCCLKLEHAPTQSNFWHFNIWIESYNTADNTFFTIKVSPKELPSASNMKKRAQAAIELLTDIVCMPDKTKEISLPQQYYIK